MINETLDALLISQTRKPDEIVIVNGGGKNNSKNYLEKWRSHFFNLKIIDTKNINLAVSRNIGLPYCKGDLVLQTDDDARPLPDWIEKLEKTHTKYLNAGVIGGDVIDGGGSFLSRVADAATFPHHTKIQKVHNVPGVNSSYKKEVIQQVGEYDISLFRGEDVDYNWRAKKKGWDVLYIPDIKVLHVHRPTWAGLFKQHYMYGRAYFLVRNKWNDMYSHYPKKVDSMKSFTKWLGSWFWIPWLDAFQKTRKMKSQITGIEFIILGLINYSNRIGTFVQKYFH